MVNRIKEILNEKNMTAMELSSSIGISRVSLSNIINDKQEASANTLSLISKCLNVPFWQLFVSPYDIKKELAKEESAVCPHCGEKIVIKTVIEKL